MARRKFRPYDLKEVYFRHRKLKGQTFKPLGWASRAAGDARGLIEIDPRQKAKCYLNTLIHEALHLECPFWSESSVKRCAGRLAWVVWRQGYRRLAK